MNKNWQDLCDKKKETSKVKTIDREVECARGQVEENKMDEQVKQRERECGHQ